MGGGLVCWLSIMVEFDVGKFVGVIATGGNCQNMLSR